VKSIQAPEFLTVILPVYNNESQLWELTTLINQQLDLLALHGEILLVDDGSEPPVWETIRRITTSLPRAKGVRFARNFGQHAAIRAGLELGQGTVFILMDADLENRPEDIPKLYWRLKDSGHQIVLAKWSNSPQGRFLSSTFHRLIADGKYDPKRLAGAATFRIFTRQIRDELLRYNEQGAVFGPIMHQLGFSIDFVSVNRDVEGAPLSRYSLKRRLRLARPFLNNLLVDVALPLFVVTGSAAVLTSLVAAAVVVFRFVAAGGDVTSTYAIYGTIVASLVGYLSVGMAVLTSIAKSILAEVRGRPAYHIAESTFAMEDN